MMSARLKMPGDFCGVVAFGGSFIRESAVDGPPHDPTERRKREMDKEKMGCGGGGVLHN